MPDKRATASPRARAPSPLLDVGADRSTWRSWRRRNHAKATGIWLVYWRKSSGRARIAYDDAVEEALCFGWIDSTVKAVDAARTAQRFSPRRAGSSVSEANRQRLRKLVKTGRMRAAGLAAVEGRFDPSDPEEPLELQQDVEEALRADEAAWRNFSSFSEEYRRLRVAYVEAGRRHGSLEFRKRLANLVRKSAAGKMFGFVRPPT